MKRYLKLLSIPLFLLALSWTLRIVWDIFGFPETEKLAEIAKNWFEVYGLGILLVSSIAEGMLLIGGYFPGVFVIFLSVILTSSPLQAVIVVSIATLGLFIAHLINYALGKYGWYKLLVRFGLRNAINNEREKVIKRGSLAIFLSYWLPSAAAITDTAAGIVQMPFKNFLLSSVISVITWDAIVGTLVYIFKNDALSFAAPGSSGGAVFYTIIAIWIITLLAFDFYKRRLLKTSGKNE